RNDRAIVLGTADRRASARQHVGTVLGECHARRVPWRTSSVVFIISMNLHREDTVSKGLAMTMTMEMTMRLGLRMTPRLRRAADQRARDDDAPWRERRREIVPSTGQSNEESAMRTRR